MKEYTFTSSDDELNTFTEHCFATDGDTWFPVAQQFFLFLKGQGFVFNIEDTLGVMRATGEFVNPEEHGHF